MLENRGCSVIIGTEHIITSPTAGVVPWVYYYLNIKYLCMASNEFHVFLAVF